MRRQDEGSGERLGSATGFGDGRSAQIARVLVVDMVLWPGALFIGVTLLLAWQARESLPALAAVAVATLVSVVVGLRQWSVMLDAVFARPQRGARTTPHDSLDSGEGSPRLTGRGGTV